MIKSFLGPFLMTFTIAMIVLILNFVWKYVDELVGKGLEWTIIVELMSYVCATLIPMALILGILLASVMTFGNLGEFNELTALKSSGISLIRTMYPVFAIVLIIGAASFLLSNYAIPGYNLKFSTLLLDIRAQRPEFDVREGQFYNGLEGYSLYIGDRSKDGMTLYDIKIYDHTINKGNTTQTLADSGYMRVSPDEENLILSLFNGYSYSEQLSENNDIQDNKPFRRDEFESQEVILQLPGTELNRSREDLYKSYSRMLNMEQLKDTAKGRYGEMIWRRNKIGHELLENKYLHLEIKKEVRENPSYYATPEHAIDPLELVKAMPVIDQQEVYKSAQNLARDVKDDLENSSRVMKIRKKGVNLYWNEWNRMLTNAFACILFFIIGAPLGAIIRRGGLGTPVVVSVLFFIVYYMLTIAGEKYARAAFVPSWVGMWASSVLLLPLGLFLTIKSNSDSRLMNTESWSLLLRKIISFRVWTSKERKLNRLNKDKV